MLNLFLATDGLDGAGIFNDFESGYTVNLSVQKIAAWALLNLFQAKDGLDDFESDYTAPCKPVRTK